MKKNDVTENHVAERRLWILYSRRNVFTLIKTIKTLPEAEIISKNIAKVNCVIVYEKTADFLEGESWFWMSMSVGNRFVVNFLSKDFASNS